MSKVYLVACVRSKLSHKALAKDLYTSPLFTKARAYTEDRADKWFILSAKYHLLNPDEIAEPYEKTLNKMRVFERQEWADVVYSQLLKLTQPDDEIYFLAGERYRELLETRLRDRGNTIHVPMYGLSIGRQLQWLNKQNSPNESLKTFYELMFKFTAIP